MARIFSKLFNVELNTEIGVITKQVLFIDREKNIEITTTSLDDVIISTITTKDGLDDTSNYLDSVNTDTALSIASYWGSKTIQEILDIAEHKNRELEESIDFEAVGLH